MRPRIVLLVLGLALTFARARPAGAADDLASNERLGARIGYIETFDGLQTYYGPGWDVTLFFNERIYSHLFLEVDVGAIYLGDIRDPELDDDITGYDNVASEMRMFYFSVGALYGFPLGSSGYTLTAGAGVGIYSVSVAFAGQFVADDISDQYFGGSGSLGLVRRVGTNWGLEANGTIHYFGTNQANDDLFWVFTAGAAEDPIMLGFALGVVIDLR